MTAFLVVLIIFLIGCGCSSAKEKSRVAKLKENNTNLPLQSSIERKIFNQMIPEYIEEYKKMYGNDISEEEYYNDKKILNILAIKYNIPTEKELKEMNRFTMICYSLLDLADLYAGCQVAKMGYTAVTCRCFGGVCKRKEPFPEDAKYNDIEYKTPYETAMSEAKRRSDINKKYPGLF